MTFLEAGREVPFAKVSADHLREVELDAPAGIVVFDPGLLPIVALPPLRHLLDGQILCAKQEQGEMEVVVDRVTRLREGDPVNGTLCDPGQPVREVAELSKRYRK